MRNPLKLISSCLLMERERWILWLPVCIGIGIGSYFGLSEEPSPWLGLVGVLGTAFCGFICRRQFTMLIVCIAFFALALGFSAAQLRTMSVAHTVLQKKIGPISLSCRVVFVENFDRGPRVTLENIRLAQLEPYETRKNCV